MAAIPEASSAAARSAASRVAQSPENGVAPRWLWASIAADIGRAGAPAWRTRSWDRGR